MHRPGHIVATAPEAESADGEPPPPVGPEPLLALDVVVEGGDWPPADVLEALCARAAGAVAASAATVRLVGPAATACVAFATDDHVRALNSRYRAKDRPTNVLSFPAGAKGSYARHGAPEPRYLGDIVLASGVVAAEARELGLPLEHHVLHLVVHGVLHLAGLDHEDDADADAMEQLETAILATLGVADPYQD